MTILDIYEKLYGKDLKGKTVVLVNDTGYWAFPWLYYDTNTSSMQRLPAQKLYGYVNQGRFNYGHRHFYYDIWEVYDVEIGENTVTLRIKQRQK